VAGDSITPATSGAGKNFLLDLEFFEKTSSDVALSGRPILGGPISHFAEQESSFVAMPKHTYWGKTPDTYQGIPWREHPFFRFNPDPSAHLRGIRIAEAQRKAEREVRAYLLGAYISN